MLQFAKTITIYKKCYNILKLWETMKNVKGYLPNMLQISKNCYLVTSVAEVTKELMIMCFTICQPLPFIMPEEKDKIFKKHF